MEAELEALVQCYCAETREGLGVAEEALVRLETAPEDRELLDIVFRVVHTLKGNSASLGFSGVAEMAHAFEDRLAALRKGERAVSSQEITILLRGADAMRQMAAAAVTGAPEWLEEHRALLSQIRDAHAPAAMPAPLPERSRRGPGRRREEVQAVLEGGRTLRVESGRLDRLLDLTGEVAIARGRVRCVVETAGSELLAQSFSDLERLSIELQDFVMKVRMVPVGPVFRQYLRIARDLAVGCGKTARVVTEGDDVEIDVTVVEHLKEVLTHLVRNAIDHGIEPPELRRAAGKDPCGTINLRARHEGGAIVIRVDDDGAGLDLERVSARARALGRLADGATLGVDEAGRIICEPGFSTAEAATELSGRGVGLDVVRQRVEQLGGALEVRTTSGSGVAFTIRLPLTLAVLDAFMVSVADECYLIATDLVLECRAFRASATERDGFGVLDQRGLALPYVRLAALLGASAAPREREQLVVVREGGRPFGLVVDAVLGQHPAVIKPLGGYLEDVAGVSGCAVLASGRIGLILDLPVLHQRLRAAAAGAGSGAPEPPSVPSTVLDSKEC